MTKKLLALGLSLTMALSLAACGGNSGSSASGSSSNTDASTSQADASASTGDTSTAGEITTAEEGKLILGTSADYPPFEFHILDENGEDQIVGLDVALGRQIAEDMGLEFEVIHMDFDNLFQLLNQGRCDMVIAAMEYNEERGEDGGYSHGHYSDFPPKIIVKAGTEDQYTSLEDFDGKVVGAQMATTKADIVTNDMPGATPSFMSSVIDLMNNLVYDKCDALVLDGAVADEYLESNPDLAAVDIDMSGYVEPYRVWVAKDDPNNLLPSINETIAKVLEDGSMDAFIAEAQEQSAQALEG